MCIDCWMYKNSLESNSLTSCVVCSKIKVCSGTGEGNKCTQCYQQDHRVLQLLRQVARRKMISTENRDSWAHSVQRKLSEIKMSTVEEILSNIMDVNQKLRGAGRTILHRHTLSLIAETGLIEIGEYNQNVRQRELEASESISRKRAARDKEADEETENNDDEEDDEEVVFVAKPLDQRNEEADHDIATVAKSQDNKAKITRNTFLGDSAASTHMGNCDEGMFDVTLINSPVEIGNGVFLTATKIGKRRVTAMQADGSTADLVLEDDKYVPELWVNLFSITKALSKGWNIGNKGINLFVCKGQVRLTFDQVFRTQKGLVLGVEMVPRTSTVGAVATVVLEKGKSIKVDDLHQILGHPSEETTRRTAAFYDWKVMGQFTPCEDCGIAKSRQKNVNKESEARSKIPGERLFIDISSIKHKSCLLYTSPSPRDLSTSRMPSSA